MLKYNVEYNMKKFIENLKKYVGNIENYEEN